MGNTGNMVDPNAQLERLYRAEYGDPTDIVMRVFGTVFGGLLLYLYTGWAASFVWGLIYASIHALQFSFLWSRRRKAQGRDALLGGLFLIVVHISFLWLPTYVAAQPDLALQFVGLLTIAITALFHLRRADTALWLVWAQIAVFAASLLYVLVQHVSHLSQPVAQLGAIMVTMMTIVYVVLTMLAARRAQIELLASAEQLAQQQKMAAIGQLAGGVAHDFNNILTVVQGNIELSHQIDDSDDKQAVLGEAQAAAKRAERLVQHLLIFARKAPMQKRRVDLVSLLEEVWDQTRSLVPERITVLIEQGTETMPVELDESQLTTAFLNLMSNAVDAIPGEGVIRVSTALESVAGDGVPTSGHPLPEGVYCVISVEDTGSGIPPEHIDRVVEPFFTTKPVGKGTGLGLSVVHGFIESLGGALTLESSGTGTKATLYIPSVLSAPSTASNIPMRLAL